MVKKLSTRRSGYSLVISFTVIADTSREDQYDELGLNIKVTYVGFESLPFLTNTLMDFLHNTLQST